MYYAVVVKSIAGGGEQLKLELLNNINSLL